MRVFYAVHNHYWEDQNLLAGLRAAGHEVVRFDPGAFHHALGPDWTPTDRDNSSERLFDAVSAAHSAKPVHLFFGYLLNQMVHPSTIAAIGQLGPVTVNYWCNGAHQFSLVDNISAAFDYCVATERQALPAYRLVGANPIYLQMAANPAVYRPYNLPIEYDVTFVGQRYADRPEYASYLLRNGIDLRIWGPGWTRDRTYGEQSLGARVTRRFAVRHPRAAARNLAAYGKRRFGDIRAVPPWDEARLRRAAGPSLRIGELIRRYSQSRVSIGFSTCGEARYRDPVKIRQIHLRDFEAPMSGAFYFVEHQDDLAEFYELETEVVTYASREELLDKLRYYLAHPEQATRIRDAGFRRARGNHTWVRRFNQLFREIWPSRSAALQRHMPIAES